MLWTECAGSRGRRQKGEALGQAGSSFCNSALASLASQSCRRCPVLMEIFLQSTPERSLRISLPHSSGLPGSVLSASPRAPLSLPVAWLLFWLLNWSYLPPIHPANVCQILLSQSPICSWMVASPVRKFPMIPRYRLYSAAQGLIPYVQPNCLDCLYNILIHTVSKARLCSSPNTPELCFNSCLTTLDHHGVSCVLQDLAHTWLFLKHLPISSDI